MKNEVFEKIVDNIQQVYSSNGITCGSIEAEIEHAEYGACYFSLNKKNVKFRVGKITPTKPGCFVTLWKRNAAGISIPHDADDPFDLYIFHVINDDSVGQFIFTRELLTNKKILSKDQHGGKRGFRLYPPWGQVLNNQAQKTQSWQLPHYFEMNGGLTTIPKKLFLLVTSVI